MNPFASCFVRPDRNIYRFACDEVSDHDRREAFKAELVTTLLTKRFAGIVGPHGTGKTTLLRSIEPHLRRNFDTVQRVTLTTDKQWSARVVMSQLEAQPLGSACLIIDGFEQLRYWDRWLLVRATMKRRTAALLLTCHHPTRLVPTCIETRWDESLARLLTEEKLEVTLPATRQALIASFENQLQGTASESRNLREVWFSLYDAFESIETAARKSRC